MGSKKIIIKNKKLFPSGYSKNNKKNKNQKSRKKNYYKHLGNLNDSGGVGDVVKKYGSFNVKNNLFVKHY